MVKLNDFNSCSMNYASYKSSTQPIIIIVFNPRRKLSTHRKDIRQQVKENPTLISMEQNAVHTDGFWGWRTWQQTPNRKKTENDHICTGCEPFVFMCSKVSGRLFGIKCDLMWWYTQQYHSSISYKIAEFDCICHFNSCYNEQKHNNVIWYENLNGLYTL